MSAKSHYNKYWDDIILDIITLDQPLFVLNIIFEKDKSVLVGKWICCLRNTPFFQEFTFSSAVHSDRRDGSINQVELLIVSVTVPARLCLSSKGDQRLRKCWSTTLQKETVSNCLFTLLEKEDGRWTNMKFHFSEIKVCFSWWHNLWKCHIFLRKYVPITWWMLILIFFC